MTALISSWWANVWWDMWDINDILKQERDNTPELVYKLPDDYDPKKEVEKILSKKWIFLEESISELSWLNRWLLEQDINNLPKYASADTGVVTDAGGNNLWFESEEWEWYEKTLFYEAKEVKLPKEAEKIWLWTWEWVWEFYIWQNKKWQFVIMKWYKYALEWTDFVQNIVEYKWKYYSIKTIEENGNLEWWIMEIKENPFNPLMNYEEFYNLFWKKIWDSFVLWDMEINLLIFDKPKKVKQYMIKRWKKSVWDVLKMKWQSWKLKYGEIPLADFFVRWAPNMVLQWWEDPSNEKKYSFLYNTYYVIFGKKEIASTRKEIASTRKENARSIEHLKKLEVILKASWG